MTSYIRSSRVVIKSRDGTMEERVPYEDLHDSFSRDFELGGTWNVSFTIVYRESNKTVFNMAKEKAFVGYNGEWYVIQQVNPEINDEGKLTNKITANHQILDQLKSIRYDTDPETTTVTTSGSATTTENSNEPKKTEVETHTLDEMLSLFFSSKEEYQKYIELDGNFKKSDAKASDGTVLDWLNQNLSSYGGVFWPQGNKLIIKTWDKLKHTVDVDFRYMYNTTESKINADVNSLVNVRKVYAGKWEQTITTTTESIDSSGSGSVSGATGQGNDFWASAIRNAANLMDVAIDDNGVALVQAQIRLESGGNETITQQIWDINMANGNSAQGLLQFTPSTFNAYAVEGHKNIKSDFDQLLAAFNIPDFLSQISGHSGWSPHGTKRSNTIIRQQTTSTTATQTKSKAQEVIDYARQFLGKPYVWGGPSGDGIHGTDCSGLCNSIYAHFGIKTGGRTTWALKSGASRTIGRSEVTTGDLGLCNNDEHVVFALDNSKLIQESNFNEPCNERAIAGYYYPITWVRYDDMYNLVKDGTGSIGTGTTSSSTTTKTWYEYKFTYRDEESIKKYGEQLGAPLKLDAVYDLNEAKAEAKAETESEPTVSLDLTTITRFSGSRQDGTNLVDDFTVNQIGLDLGAVVHATVKEQNVDSDVTVVKISGNDACFNDNAEITYTFNSANSALHNINESLYLDIRSLNVKQRSITDWLDNDMTISTHQADWIDNILRH